MGIRRGSDRKLLKASPKKSPRRLPPVIIVVRSCWPHADGPRNVMTCSPDEGFLISEDPHFHLDTIQATSPGNRSQSPREWPPAGFEALWNCARPRLDSIATAPLISARCSWRLSFLFAHTEFLAHLTGIDDYAMGFVAANLRIVLISTHVPLSEAIRLVRREGFEKTIRLADDELRRWGIARPRIAVAALNPHGAEGGLFGIEEASEIMPAVEACRAIDGINVSGPFSADTVFLRASRGEFDAVVACYHDQAMISGQCLFFFGEASNVTFGFYLSTHVGRPGDGIDIAERYAEHSAWGGISWRPSFR